MRPRAWAGAALLAISAWASSAQALTLSDNSANSSSGSLSADSLNVLAASFVASEALALSVSSPLQAILNAQTSSGAAVLQLYSSDSSGLVPDSLLASFTAAGSTASTETFTLSGLSLAAGSTYWLVLGNGSRGTQWSWTTDGSGTGTGFTGTWASSDDGGLTYFTGSTLYPLQMSISTVSAVPEVNGLVLMLAGLPLMLLVWRRQTKTSEGL